MRRRATGVARLQRKRDAGIVLASRSAWRSSTCMTGRLPRSSRCLLAASLALQGLPTDRGMSPDTAVCEKPGFAAMSLVLSLH